MVLNFNLLSKEKLYLCSSYSNIKKIFNMEASYFIDNKERIFVPYKGWMTRDSNGIESKDEFTTNIKGPFKDIPDPLGHGNYHTLDNLIGHDGKKYFLKV